MKFQELSFSTKVKLAAGLGLLWGGLILLLSTNNNLHILTILMGNLLHLDGRISKLEEESEKRESNGQQAD